MLYAAQRRAACSCGVPAKVPKHRWLGPYLRVATAWEYAAMGFGEAATNTSCRAAGLLPDAPVLSDELCALMLLPA